MQSLVLQITRIDLPTNSFLSLFGGTELASFLDFVTKRIVQATNQYLGMCILLLLMHVCVTNFLVQYLSSQNLSSHTMKLPNLYIITKQCSHMYSCYEICVIAT